MVSTGQRYKPDALSSEMVLSTLDWKYLSSMGAENQYILVLVFFLFFFLVKNYHDHKRIAHVLQQKQKNKLLTSTAL